MAAKLELFGAALWDGDGFWYGLVPLKAFVEGRNLGREDAGIQIRPVVQERCTPIFSTTHNSNREHGAPARTVKSGSRVSMNMKVLKRERPATNSNEESGPQVLSWYPTVIRLEATVTLAAVRSRGCKCCNVQACCMSAACKCCKCCK